MNEWLRGGGGFVKAMRKPQKVSQKATKSRIVKIATGTAVHEFATPGHRSGDRFLIAGVSKAVKVCSNPPARRNPLAVEISIKPRVKYRRASATSDEVFANLAEAFSSL
jgi:hypothetical protein